MNRSLLMLLPSALLAAAGCDDRGSGEPIPPLEVLDEPCIRVEPEEIVFNSVEIADGDRVPEVRVVTVSNTCENTLELTKVELAGVAPGAFSLANLDTALLGPDRSATFDVTFEPPTVGSSDDQVLIESNDTEKPVMVVRLEGEAVGPDIRVTPEGHDYGAPYIGCEIGQPFRITNEGTADLIVSEITPFTASPEEFSVDLDQLHNGPLPFAIGPYDSAQGGPAVDVYLDYLALDTFSDEAYLVFASNDPLQPEVVSEVSGTGTRYGTNVDHFEQLEHSRTDIVFTLDRSCSMSETIDSVAESFDVFVRTLASLDADPHVAIVVDDDGCVVGPDPFIDASFSGSEAADAFRTMADADFSLSSYGSNTTRGFTLASAALSTKSIGSGGCNHALYRDDAFLSIVHVSAHEEQSLNSWSTYVALFQSLKSDPEDVKIHAIAGDYPSGCGSASAGTGYYEATVATGGLFLSICTEDWAATLEDLATESVRVHDRFELTQQPVPQTLEVKIGGVRVHVGWEYEISSNSVVFQADAIPAGGSQLEVSYQRMPDCEG